MNDQSAHNQLPATRYWFILLLVAAVGWAGLSCQKTDVDRTFDGPYFVRFTDSSLTYKESYSKVIAINVHNAGPQLSQPITVNYTISGSAREGKDYTIAGTKGVVIIPANQSTGQISLKLINNANNILESKSLVFTLTGVQPSTLQVGLGNSGALGRQLKFTIQTDCLFGGFYTGSAKFGTQVFTVPNIEITSTDCKSYLLSNWNINIPFFNFDATMPTLRFIDNGDNSLTIPGQGNSELGTTDTLRGNGSWNPRNRVITLNLQTKIRLSTKRDTTLFYTQTYTPQ